MMFVTTMMNRQQSERAEKQIRRLAEGDEHLIQELLGGATLSGLQQGQFAFRSGDECAAYLVVLQGSIRVQLISAGGREVTLYRVDPGNSCVLTTSCLLGGSNYPAEAIAETDVEALGISRPVFRSALANYAVFRDHVFDRFSNRLTNVIMRIEDLVFESVNARLARKLLELDQENDENVTHQELAVELGTAREVISRHLKDFEKRGLVKLGRGQVTVIDRSALSKLSNQS